MKRWTRRPEGSTWGDFGADDEIGRLNLLTEEKVLQAVREVRAGKVFCLSLPLDLPGGNVLNPRRHAPTLKPTFREGTPYLNFQMSQVQPDAVDVLSDDQVTLSMQYSTQWDGLCHVGAMFDIQGDGEPRRVYYNGYAGRRGRVRRRRRLRRRRLLPAGGGSYARKLGINRYAEKGMQGRGVLVDLARAFGPGRTLVGHAELQAAMRAQDVAVESGDMLVLRTGFAEAIVAMGGQPDPHELGARAPCSTAPTRRCWTGSRSPASPPSAPTTTPSRPIRRAPPAPATPSCRCITIASSSWACRWPNSGT